MKCPACTSDENKVITTKASPLRVARLRCCCACKHRWQTVELESTALTHMEAAADTIRSFTALSQQLHRDAQATHR